MSPLEPLAMKLHGLVLIPALLGIGRLFVANNPKVWGHERQRITGIALCLVLAVLIACGYMLYYFGGEALRDWTSLIHWGIGIGLPAIFAWHYINGLRARRKPSR